MEDKAVKNHKRFNIDSFKRFTECARNCTGIDLLSKKVIQLLQTSVTAETILVVISDDLEVSSPVFISDNYSGGRDNSLLAAEVIGSVTVRQIDSPESKKEIDIFENPDLDGTIISILATHGKRFSIFIQPIIRASSTSAEDFTFLEMLSNVLSITLDKMTIDAADLRNLNQILAAKQEWETSIDHLTQLICFLDERGYVLRANKILETWYGGSVKDVKGKTVHSLLHPGCTNVDCELHNKWRTLWGLSDTSGFESAEVYDHLTERSISMTIRKSRLKNPLDRENHSGAVLIIQDISDSLWDKYLLESYSQELFVQLQNKNLEINKINKYLASEKNNHTKIRESLIETESKLQSLSAQLLTAHEEERKRIAGELHDSIGQSLSVVKLRLQNVLSTDISNHDLERFEADRNSLLKVVDLTIDEVRRISMGLRPSILDDIGLLATLQWFTREFKEACRTIQLDTDFTIEESTLTDTQKVVIFRIIQESLNNITKHAQAKAIFISVTATSNSIDLHIEDDGVGFNHLSQKNPSGFGLGSMRERAKLSGGELVISSEPGRGTVIKGIWQAQTPI
jgi:signal transduction histidine kinase